MGVIPETKLSEQIKKIYESRNLSEAEKDRFISELLKQTTPQADSREFSPVKGYIVSVVFPPLGLFIGGHYLARYGEEGVKPGLICMVLTSASLVIQLLLFKNVLKVFLSGISSQLKNPLF